MGIKNYLIDGVSGVGKTAVAEELERRGHHVIHGDRVLAYVGDPLTGEALHRPWHDNEYESVAWLNKHWIWPVDKVKALTADHTHPISFFCGASRNTQHFIHLFEKVFVLEVDLATLNQRLGRRREDEFGGRQAERELIAKLHATQEDIPETAVRIDATGPLARVVDEVLLRCGNVGQ